MRYAKDVLAPELRRPRPGRGPVPEVEAEPGLVAEDTAGRFCGAVVAYEKDAVTLEDRDGKRRAFPLPGPFLIDGQRVTLVRPAPEDAGRPKRTASGSIAAPASPAKVAKASRIYVEGKHDAELVEKIWGDDLRDAGVVVEYLEGVDDLPAIVAEFRPGPDRRLGVLVDHLVTGSKESKITSAVRSPDVLVAGHPFIDIWAAVKPAAAGIKAWPDVPRGEPWKEGVLRRIGWPCATPADVAAAWRRILRGVTTYADLEPDLLGRVEELIDFVTVPLPLPTPKNGPTPSNGPTPTPSNGPTPTNGPTRTPTNGPTRTPSNGPTPTNGPTRTPTNGLDVPSSTFET